MPRVSQTVTLTEDDKEQIRKSFTWPSLQKKDILRASIILLAAQGLQNKAIAKQLGVTETVVAKWRKRFLRFRVRPACLLSRWVERNPVT